MKKYRKPVFLLLLVLLYVTGIKVNARDVDLEQLWGAGVTTFKNDYNSLPNEIKELFPRPNSWDTYEKEDAYPVSVAGYQCTWYAYHRAKEMGREYSKFEGDGGYWGNDVSNYGIATGTLGDNTAIPQVPISITGGTNLGVVAPAYHVMYCEYVDSKGNILISEGNVRNGGNGTDTEENYRVILKSNPDFQYLSFVKPLNADSIENYGKNPDGGTVGTGDKTTDSTSTDTNGEYKDAYNPFSDKKYSRNNLGVQTKEGIIRNDTIVKVKAGADVLNDKVKYIIFAVGAVLFVIVSVALFWYVAVPKMGYTMFDKLDNVFGTDVERNRSNTLQLFGMAVTVYTLVGIVLSGIYIYPIIGLLELIQKIF